MLRRSHTTSTNHDTRDNQYPHSSTVDTTATAENIHDRNIVQYRSSPPFLQNNKLLNQLTSTKLCFCVNLADLDLIDNS